MEWTFINTLPYISNPIQEFADFKFVSREKKIYPKLVWQLKASEVSFFVDFIVKHDLKNIIDFGVGGGQLLCAIAQKLDQLQYPYKHIEANEVELSFIMQALSLFYKHEKNILIHNANRFDLPEATPKYDHKFDFGYLTGNSLTYVGGGSREYTKKAQTGIVNKFAKLIEKWWYLLVDTKDYDYIKTLMHLSPEQVRKAYTFDTTVYYHGAQKEIVVFPAYISETVIVFHYYDLHGKQRSKLDLYPIYHHDMMDILSEEFEVVQVRYDFQEDVKEKCVLRQYLARKK